MYILGLHFLGHDLSCCLLDKAGKLVFHAEQERYSNIKGGEFVFHPRLVKKILYNFDIDISSISYMALVGGYNCDYGMYEGNLAYNIIARRSHYRYWETRLRSEFPNVREIRRYGHHQCHAASAYHFSGYSAANIFIVDGYGEAACESIWKGLNRKLSPIQNVEFPHSIAYLYRSFATWLNLDGWEREGKLMALSSYGEPKYQSDIKNNLLKFGNPIRIGDQFLSTQCKHTAWAEIISNTFGPRRKSEEEFSLYHKDIAASIQYVFEDYLIARVQWITSQSEMSNLACAGGAFLNSKAIGRLRKATNIENLWIQPLSSDSGLSLGACALLATELGRSIQKMEHLYLGEEISEENLQGLSCERLDNPEEWVAEKISEGMVVGWCNGRMEVGPRALGNRSILADATNPKMRNRVNLIKSRENWRPFAPAILEDDLSSYIESPVVNPFMTEVQTLKSPDLLPSVAHCDETSRVQAVNNSHNARLYKILCEIKEINGIGGVLNTSLNVQGMPIARTLGDIMLFYKKSRIDELVINGFRLLKTGVHVYSGDDAVDSMEVASRKFTVCVTFGDLTDSQQKACSSIRTHIDLGLSAVLTMSWNTNYIQHFVGEVLLVAVPWYADALGNSSPRLARNILKLKKIAKEIYTVSPDGFIRSVGSLEWVRNVSLISDSLGDFEDHVAKLSTINC